MKSKHIIITMGLVFVVGTLSFFLKKNSGLISKRNEANPSSVPDANVPKANVHSRATEMTARPGRSTSSEGQAASDFYRFSQNLALTSIPADLHAVSAIEILAPDQVTSLLDGTTKDFAIPLSSETDAKLSVIKVVVENENEILLVGNVIGRHVASYFDIKFEGGVLESGIINLFGDDDVYRIRAMEDGRLVVALQDPNIPLGRCSCCSGGTIPH